MFFVYCFCVFPFTPNCTRLFPSPISAAAPADSLYRVRKFGTHLNLRSTRLIRLPTVAPGWGYPDHPTIGKPAISETVRDDGPAPVSYERRFSRRAASGFPCLGKLSEFARLACFEIESTLLGISLPHGRGALRRTLGPQ